MTKEEIIARFQLWIDDTSDLSDDETSDLFDDIYSDVCDEMAWEFTKRPFNGTTNGTATIALNDDFNYLVENANHTELNEEAHGPCVFVGLTFTRYKVISYSDRQQYHNRTGFCYIDILNNNLVFCQAPAYGLAVSYDYQANMPALEDGDSPIFPTRYHQIIFYGMCVSDFIIQQVDKGKTYAPDNQAKYDSVMARMQLWNAKLVQIN